MSHAKIVLVQLLVGALLCILIAVFSDHQSRAGVGDASVYSNDGYTYQLETHSYAIYRRGHYFERYTTPKEVHVRLSSGRTCLFSKTYDIIGWDISWETRWNSPTDATIRVFDFGAGFDHRGSTRTDVPRRAIGEIHLHVDAQSGNVTEHWIAA